MTKHVVVVSLLLALTCSCCKKNPSRPDLTNSLRQLSWTVDTIAYPGSHQTLMSAIWGSSPNDVYVVGHNSTNAGLMYHYDGHSWQSVKLTAREGGPFSGAIDLNEVHGFSPTDVWAVGKRIYSTNQPSDPLLDSSFIAQWTGTEWKEHKINGSRAVTSIFGISANDLWVGGLNGTLNHFDGTQWVHDSVAVAIPPDADPLYVFQSITGTTSSGLYLLLIARPPSGEIQYIFERGTNQWVLVDSTYGIHRIWSSPSGSLYGLGYGLRRWTGPGNWTEVFSPSGYSVSSVFGLGDDDLILAGSNGSNGGLFHFNGSDWYEYRDQELSNVIFCDVWTDSNEAFVVGYTFTDPSVSIVLHGK